MAQREHRQIFPQPGWVEHDAEEIWANVQRVVAEALRRRRRPAPAGLAAVGITNQRETTVVWDRATGRPVANAIVWQDTRTGPLLRELAEAYGEDRFRARTGLAAGHLLRRAEAALAARPRRRAARARRAGRGAVRHDGQLADLEADRSSTSPT